jgi:hypothetical protein
MKSKILVVLFVSALILSSCGALPDLGLGGKKEAQVQEELQIQEIQAEPTEAALSESQFFREDFSKDINNEWGLRVVSGLEKQLLWSQTNNRLRLQTLPPNDVNFIFLNKDRSFDDVVVQAEVENLGPLDNFFSLICRANAEGWYEFRISSNGYYELLRFDQYRYDEGDNAYTNLVEKRVGSTLIKSGLNKNTFALSCVGNLITAFVNGEQVYWQKRPLAIEDNTFSEGSIGFGILGYGKELDMVYNWVEAVKPQ